MERETFFSYLYDKVQEVSWKCAHDTIFFDNYERYHPLTSPIYNGVVTNGIATNLAQPPYIYGSSNYGGQPSVGLAGTNLYPSSGYNRYNGYNNYYDRNRYDNTYGNRYGSYGYGSGDC